MDWSITIVPAVGEAHRFDPTTRDGETVAVTPTDQIEPYDSEYTGYMGNWGNTMDRWYRRAALVIWPRTRSFAIAAKGDPAAAIDDLLNRHGTDEPPRRSVAADSATLLRYWGDAVRDGDQRSLFPKALRLAHDLDDAELAWQYLDPFAIEAITPTDSALLLALTDRYGLGWFDERLAAWTEERRPHYARATTSPDRAAWVEDLPNLCGQISDPNLAPGSAGHDIAAHMLAVATDWLVEEIGRATTTTSPSRREDTLARLVLPVVAVLRTARIVDDPQARDRSITALCEPTGRTVSMLVDVVAACTPLTPDESADIGADTIALHCRKALDNAIGQPPRAPDDWSITDLDPAGCCDDCATLASFLNDPEAQTTTWPLAKPRRQHIHRRIDEAELPVTHRTRREGSPHKLVLTKTTELHRRDTERRAAISAALATLDQFSARHQRTDRRSPR